MDSISFEEWLHATDEERAEALEAWRSEPAAGRHIVTAVARLFQRECIYELEAAHVATAQGRWLIDAYLNPDDYALLSGRKPVKFLGIPVRFHPSPGTVTTH